jgi:ABC-type nickel/cobalt efflux system permease component RcnA
MAADVSVRTTTSLRYRDDSTGDRIGWREITAVGDGTTLTSSTVPTRSVSRALTAYPADLLTSPLDVRSAAVRARPGGPAAADPLSGLAPPATAQRRGVDRLTASFTDLIGHPHLGLVVGFVALALAVALGAVHALAPGHGKTVMAAYLVSERGSLQQVVGIGLTVTATHTLGVLALGTTLSLSTTLAPERLYPWLGITSGLLLVSIGVSLLRTALRHRRQSAPAHEHGHGHLPHAHGHPHVHSHGGRPHSHVPLADPTISRRGLLMMGLAGGMVPTPSAVVVLLGAIALHRAWFGVLVVLAYGVGMATTLVGIGVLLSRARSRMSRTLQRRRRAGAALRLLPLMTASLIVLIGSVLTIRAGTSPYLHLP